MKKIIELNTLYYNYEDKTLRSVIDNLKQGFHNYNENLIIYQCIQSRPVYIDVINNTTHNNVEIVFYNKKWYPIFRKWHRTSGNQINIKEKIEIDTDIYIKTINDIEYLAEYIKNKSYTEYIPIYR